VTSSKTVTLLIILNLYILIIVDLAESETSQNDTKRDSFLTTDSESENEKAR
jgi:hypothetical protein